MIVTNKNSWLRMIFAIHGTTMGKVWPRVFAVTAFAGVVTYFSSVAGVHKYSLTPAPFAVVGLSLAIFLAFRNNAAYDRYWEGRKLWGGMVNATRTFAIQLLTVIRTRQSDEAAEVKLLHERFVRLLLAYVNSLRHRLRDSNAEGELHEYIESKAVVEAILRHANIPVAIGRLIGDEIATAEQRGWLSVFHVPLLHSNLAEMMSVQGACERIKTTPIPYTYSVLTHRTTLLYCLALPCGLHDTVGVLTPLVVGFVAYAFLGLDAVGDEIEQPFGLDDNHLPLHAITRTIEINLLQLEDIDSSQIPPAIHPHNHLLQ